MGVTVIAQPANTPPRFVITVSTPDNATMNAVTLTRTVRGVTVPVEVQPAAGFSTRTVSDYLGDWGTPVVYTATITTDSGVAAYTAAAAVLDPAGAWMIHPLTPVASLCFDQRRTDTMGIRTLGQVARPSTSNRLRPIGAAYPTQIRVGPRSASQLQITLTTVTAAEEAALWAILNDQAPLLLRIPPSWGWGFEDGYYDIDSPTMDRTIQHGPNPQREWTLPIFRVTAPAGDQQSTWSYADIVAAFPDYPTFAAAYADYPSVVANIRR